jgi:hypothetical protein
VKQHAKIKSHVAAVMAPSVVRVVMVNQLILRGVIAANPHVVCAAKINLMVMLHVMPR